MCSLPGHGHPIHDKTTTLTVVGREGQFQSRTLSSWMIWLTLIERADEQVCDCGRRWDGKPWEDKPLWQVFVF